MVVEIIRLTSITSVLVPVVASLRSKPKTTPFVFVIVTIWFSFFTEIVITVLSELSIPNLVIANIYYLGLFLLLTLFYRDLLPERNRWLYLSITLFLVFSFLNSISFQGITEYQGYSVAAGGLLLIVWSILYFNSLLKKLPSPRILKYGPFWINAGIAFYFSFNMLLFIFSNFVFTKMTADVGMVFWSFHNVNNIIKNILFAIGVYHAGKGVADSEQANHHPSTASGKV